MKNIYIIDLNEDKRKYLPYNDNNFQNIVWVNSFCNKNLKLWKKKIVSVQERVKCYLNLEINLAEKTTCIFM